MPQLKLSYPQLVLCERNGLAYYSDEGLYQSLGVRIAFTQRQGGVSSGAYSSLNLATHVGDDLAMVAENRKRLLAAISAPEALLLAPNQVHGTEIAVVDAVGGRQFEQCMAQIGQGADGIIVNCENVAALLCFADCMPVILVAPNGAFAVVHAGWRGVMALIAPKALDMLCEHTGALPEECNAYIGPFIHAECFEVGAELAAEFGKAFGGACVPDERHVDLGCAMRMSLLSKGVDPQRIADVQVCTACESERFFSYRAQDGCCGRHGAIAVRIER